MDVKYILGISVFLLVTLFAVVWASMGVDPLYSFEVDMLCSDNDTFLYRDNETWACHNATVFTGNCTSGVYVHNGLITGCV